MTRRVIHPTPQESDNYPCNRATGWAGAGGGAPAVRYRVSRIPRAAHLTRVCPAVEAKTAAADDVQDSTGQEVAIEQKSRRYFARKDDIQI